MKTPYSYDDVQKRLGTERSQFEWPVTLLVIVFPFLATFASYACLMLFGPQWVMLFAAFPLVGMLPLILRFRHLSSRAARSQAAFEKLVGYPSAYLAHDALLEFQRVEMRTRSCIDPVTGTSVFACSVYCIVYRLSPRGYERTGAGILAFAFGSRHEADVFLDWFKPGRYCQVGEDGPELVYRPYVNDDPPVEWAMGRDPA